MGGGGEDAAERAEAAVDDGGGIGFGQGEFEITEGDAAEAGDGAVEQVHPASGGVHGVFGRLAGEGAQGGAHRQVFEMIAERASPGQESYSIQPPPRTVSPS